MRSILEPVIVRRGSALKLAGNHLGLQHGREALPLLLGRKSCPRVRLGAWLELRRVGVGRNLVDDDLVGRVAAAWAEATKAYNGAARINAREVGANCTAAAVGGAT